MLNLDLHKVAQQILASVLILLFTASSAFSAEVAGISVADSIKTGGTTLVLNGAGMRTKFFLKLYVCGLYLSEKSDDPVAIIKADEVMAIRMQMATSLITASKMEKTIRSGFENSTGGNTAPISSRIDQYISVFKNGVDKNEVYDLIYTPDKGVEVFRDGEFVALIEDLIFKQALFGIWLSDSPAQESLKMEMLGIS